MPKLDKTKPYATVIGPAEETLGRVFEQNHTHFDAAGNEWVAPEPPVDQAVAQQAAIDEAVEQARAEEQAKLDERIAAAVAAALAAQAKPAKAKGKAEAEGDAATTSQA